MNVVFMGTPDYSVRILRHLKEAGFNIKAVFTQPDKPVGRKQILTPSEVKIYAQNELVGVPVFTPVSIYTLLSCQNIEVQAPFKARS